MAVFLHNPMRGEALWYFVLPGTMLDDTEFPEDDYVEDYDGELDRVGIDDRELTIDEAMEIAHEYGGGEFDNETAGIVAALCVLRDAYPSGGDDVS